MTAAAGGENLLSPIVASAVMTFSSVLIIRDALRLRRADA
jgi:cation transport ATPase